MIENSNFIYKYCNFKINSKFKINILSLPHWKVKIFSFIIDVRFWFCQSILWSRLSCTFCKSCAKFLCFSFHNLKLHLSLRLLYHVDQCIFQEFFYDWYALDHTFSCLHLSFRLSTHCTHVSWLGWGCSNQSTNRKVRHILCLCNFEDWEAYLWYQT